MVTEKAKPLLWSEEHDNLVHALEVLASLKPSQKIRVFNSDKYHIAPEDRNWFVGCGRAWTGDGCQRSIAIICTIMDECLNFSALAKESTDETIKTKHLVLKNLYPQALQGVRFVCDLYGSEAEKEYEAASKLAKKINLYILAVTQLLASEKAETIPKAAAPCEIPKISPSITYLVLTNVALPTLSLACSLVAYYSSVTSTVKFLVHLMTFDKNEKNAQIMLLFKAADMLKATNIL